MVDVHEVTVTIVGRGFLTPYFMKTPPILHTHTPPLSKFCPTPLSRCLQYPPPLFFLLSYFFGRMGDHATFDAPFDGIIDYICHTLVPLCQKDLAVCFMQEGVKFTEVWHIWLFAGTLIWYQTHTHTHTHKHKDTQYTQEPIEWCTHINRY